MFCIMKISNNNIRTIHAINCARTIIASIRLSIFISPAHAATPPIIIITHSHIIKRMNRQAKFTINRFLIKKLRMPDTKFFKHFFVILIAKSINKFANDFHWFHTRRNLNNGTIFKFDFIICTSICVFCKCFTIKRLLNKIKFRIIQRIIRLIIFNNFKFYFTIVFNIPVPPINKIFIFFILRSQGNFSGKSVYIIFIGIRATQNKLLSEHFEEQHTFSFIPFIKNSFYSCPTIPVHTARIVWSKPRYILFD